MNKKNQKLHDCIMKLCANIEAHQAELELAKSSLVDAIGEITNSAQGLDLAGRLYWEVSIIAAKDLADGVGVTPKTLRVAALPYAPHKHCIECDVRIIPKSRSQYTANFDKPGTCGGCKVDAALSAPAKRLERPVAQRKKAAWRDRLRELENMPYYKYLRTKEWRKRRATHLRLVGYKCQVCNSSAASLNVHHRTYARRGHEDYEDLIVLCPDCHTLFSKESKLAENGDDWVDVEEKKELDWI